MSAAWAWAAKGSSVLDARKSRRRIISSPYFNSSTLHTSGIRTQATRLRLLPGSRARHTHPDCEYSHLGLPKEQLEYRTRETRINRTDPRYPGLAASILSLRRRSGKTPGSAQPRDREPTRGASGWERQLLGRVVNNDGWPWSKASSQELNSPSMSGWVSPGMASQKNSTMHSDGTFGGSDTPHGAVWIRVTFAGTGLSRCR